MFSGLCIVSAGMVLILLVTKSFGKPEASDTENPTVNNDEYINKTKSRILTHPPTGEFYGREQEIIFPDAINDRADMLSRNGIPKCSDGLPYCEHVDNYPYSYIKQVLDQTKISKSLFGQDEAPPEIANRLGDEDEEFVCKAKKLTIFPRMGQTKNDKWKVIVNQGEEGYVQAVGVEICQRPNGDCDIPGSPLLDPGYTMSCRQKYIYRSLFSLDGKGEVVPDSFKMPSACCCAYRRNFDFQSRFGKSSATTPTDI